jgi:hypothetical protein
MRLLLLIAPLWLAACSPEAERTRGGGPGGDTGNRPEIVRMHEGSSPFEDTPKRIFGERPPLDTASQAQEYGRR